jgi:hypothetical protein
MGHLIRLGVLPTDAPWTGAIAFAGTREGTAAAQRGVTATVLEFLTDVTARTPVLPHQEGVR